MEHFFVVFIGNFRFQRKSFQIENYLGDVLFNSFYGGELVLYAAVEKFDSFHRRAGQCGEKNSSEAVADCKTETLFQRLANDFRIEIVVFQHFEFRHIHFDHDITSLNFNDYLEYNSTIMCSAI